MSFGNRSLVTVIVLTFVASIGIVACGAESGKDDSISPGRSRGSVRACLELASAQFADSSKDLKFLAEAEAQSDVLSPGLVYDRHEVSVVRVLTSTENKNGGPSWTVWYGQPVDSTKSVWDLVDADLPATYVAFVDQPSDSVQKRASRCVTFGAPSSVRPSKTLHRSDLTQ